MEKTEFKKFIRGVLLFISPFILALVIELFVLPIDFFTYRVWESLKVDSSATQLFLPGPFYPDRQVVKTEAGDLGFRTRYEVKKDVVWKTDSWGFRADESEHAYDILLFGDSTLVGTSLDQEDTLASQLMSKGGLTAYPAGAKELANALYNPHFESRKPKAVVLVSIERFINSVPLSLEEHSDSKVYFVVMNFISRFNLGWTSDLFVFADRLIKQGMYHSLRAKVDNFLQLKTPAFVYGEPPMLFLQGDAANQEVPQETADAIADRMSAAGKTFADKGIRFIFLPVPNKESIYWKLLPDYKQPDFLPRLTKALRERNVEVVDTESAFLQASEKQGKILYHRDDTHWNAAGVGVAADALLSVIGGKK